MRRTCSVLFAISISISLALVAACGGGGSSVDSGGPTIDGSSGTPDAMAGELVPDPGTVVGGEWTDVEPNDTPGDATPVGVMNGPVWAGFVEPYTQIDSPTDVDYFVFRTADAAALPNVNIQFCWGGAVNLLDATLFEVLDSHVGPQVLDASSTNTSCETVVAIGEAPTLLTPDTIYLLELRAGPGLEPAGLPGMYGA